MTAIHAWGDDVSPRDTACRTLRIKRLQVRILPGALTKAQVRGTF